MNILYLCTRVPYPPTDGGTIGVWSLVKNLSKLGNKITVLSLNTKKHYININHIQSELPENVDILCVDIDTSIKILPAIQNLLFSKAPYIISRFYSKEYKEQLKNILLSKKFDVVQFESPMMFFYISTIYEYSNAPVIARTANIENEIWERISKQEKNILRKKYYKILASRMKNIEIKSIESADDFIAVTDINTQYFSNKIKKNLGNTIQTGVDGEDILSSPVHHSEISFCFIGALDWRPNQEGLFWFLENVWKKFIDSNKNYKFHVAGRNASEHTIKTISKYSNVIFHGEVSDAKEYIRSHSVMLVPLLSGSGMRVKIVEGMANGAAIISTTIGAEGINVEHNKNILIADTPDEFINSMTALSKNVELLNKLSNSGLDFIKTEYDNLVIAQKLNNIYLELLEKKQAN